MRLPLLFFNILFIDDPNHIYLAVCALIPTVREIVRRLEGAVMVVFDIVKPEFALDKLLKYGGAQVQMPYFVCAGAKALCFQGAIEILIKLWAYLIVLLTDARTYMGDDILRIAGVMLYHCLDALAHDICSCAGAPAMHCCHHIFIGVKEQNGQAIGAADYQKLPFDIRNQGIRSGYQGIAKEAAATIQRRAKMQFIRMHLLCHYAVSGVYGAILKAKGAIGFYQRQVIRLFGAQMPKDALHGAKAPDSLKGEGKDITE